MSDVTLLKNFKKHNYFFFFVWHHFTPMCTLFVPGYQMMTQEMVFVKEKNGVRKNSKELSYKDHGALWLTPVLHSQLCFIIGRRQKGEK